MYYGPSVIGLCSFPVKANVTGIVKLYFKMKMQIFFFFLNSVQLKHLALLECKVQSPLVRCSVKTPGLCDD